jgi:M3 family oligoendopeptidase
VNFEEVAFSTMNFSELPYRRISADEAESTTKAMLAKWAEGSDASQQAAVVREWDRIQREWRHNLSMSHVRFSQDTTHPANVAEKDYWDKLRPVLQLQENTFLKCVVNSPQREGLERIFGTHVFNLWQTNLDSMSESVVGLKQEQAALVSRYSTLMAQLETDFMGERVNLSQLATHYGSADRAKRLLARQAQDRALGKCQQELDSIFDELVAIRHAIAGKLGHGSYTTQAYKELQRTDYGPDDVAAFRREVELELVPIASKIRARQAENLGLEDYRFHDESVQDPRGATRPKGDHDWMLKRATEMFDEMGDDFGSFFRMMHDKSLLDLQARKGKSGGGYCTMFPEEGLPFIFANFNGSNGDVRVFTHECGHAFQCYQSRDQPLLDLVWPTLEACEIHSMSLEFLSYEFMDKFFGDDASRFRREHLEQALLFIPYGVAVDEFQHEIYSRPEASPQERAELWQSLERKYLPHRKYHRLPYFESGRFWQRQGHIFRSPFYYIDYCLAQCCALQFWSQSRHDRAETFERYRKLCRLGGSKPFTGLMQEVGLVSPFAPGGLRGVMMEVAEEIGL